ncbi:hypothetical protein GSI_08382 [Ganoderma sinense ZZ0214-1]|uniref:Uncharacterized protein n=1 Tax=Ganoderma sinense ZZ0214-1 TaxID=1077348 RepID=A0A2G8S6N8_9APHY|nr:hypothetical protein GSI_08382 [Ganoderma sinense ZZ0214-1]
MNAEKTQEKAWPKAGGTRRAAGENRMAVGCVKGDGCVKPGDAFGLQGNPIQISSAMRGHNAPRPTVPRSPPPVVLDALVDVGESQSSLIPLTSLTVPLLSPAMFAQYSPLFTSGLLSESNTPSTSRRPSLELRQKDPRESLPVDASVDSLYETPTSEEDGIFLTLAPRRRDAGNSFLSLDLAESQSMRSMSLRRNDTITSRFGRTVSNSVPLPMSPFASSSELASGSHPRKSLVHHSSREGLPGVKPVPSSQLPAVPRRKRPADLSITFSASLSPLASSGSSSLHRSAYSEPSILSPISPLLSPIARSYFAFSPPTSPSAIETSHPAAQAPRSAPAALPLHARPSVRSTVSVRTRQVNRSAALAALEGRVERKARHQSRPSNFMSMSDDEDDGDLDETSPASSSSPTSARVLTPIPIHIQPTLLEVLQEEEDVVVPQRTAASRRRLSSPPSAKAGRSRRGTLESLLSPLTNFIDFGDNEGSTRSWRSFVEIS